MMRMMMFILMMSAYNDDMFCLDVVDNRESFIMM